MDDCDDRVCVCVFLLGRRVFVQNKCYRPRTVAFSSIPCMRCDITFFYIATLLWFFFFKHNIYLAFIRLGYHSQRMHWFRCGTLVAAVTRVLVEINIEADDFKLLRFYVTTFSNLCNFIYYYPIFLQILKPIHTFSWILDIVEINWGCLFQT